MYRSSSVVPVAVNDNSDLEALNYMGTPSELPRISSSFKNKGKIESRQWIEAKRLLCANRDANAGADRKRW